MKTLAIITAIAALPALAQRNGDRGFGCNDNNNNGRQFRHCEMRDQSTGFAGRLNVDGGTNGGISIKGADQSGVTVHAKVETWADDEMTAKSLASQIRLDLSAGQVAASGPAETRGQGWSVSYEILVPRNGDFVLKAHNGGISIADVRGNIQFETSNGGVNLSRLAGNVEGKTTNGGVTVVLAGNRWDGTKLDARTTNGGVNITMPENYSAHFEGSTVNGHFNIPNQMQTRSLDSREAQRSIKTDLGSGGPTIHIETMNGGVNIKKAAL